MVGWVIVIILSNPTHCGGGVKYANEMSCCSCNGPAAGEMAFIKMTYNGAPLNVFVEVNFSLTKVRGSMSSH